MSTLEKRLGVKLCERGRSGFRLTEEGRTVYDIARRLTGTLSAASSELASLRNTLVGKLRIGTVDNVANNPVARIHEAIRTFDQRKHQVAISVEVVSPQDIERQVSDGILDIGIGPRIASLSSLDYELLFTERQHLYCTRLHPLFSWPPESWTPETIASQKYAGHICPLPGELGSGLFREVSMAHNMESVSLLILSGRFIGFLPCHYAEYWVRKGEMKAIQEDKLFYDNSFYSIRSRRQRANRVVRQFFLDLVGAHRNN